MSLNKEKNFVSAVVYLYNNEREVAAFRAKWKKDLDAGDPYYNPNFTLDAADYSLKMD